MISSRRFRWVPALLCLLASSPPGARAADLEEVAEKLRDAREKYSEMRQHQATYGEKTEVQQTLQVLQAGRGELHARVRELQIEVDSYPRRRTNYQEEVFQTLLAARRELTEVDRQIEGCRATLREIDERALAQTSMNRNRPVPANRREIQGVFPRIRDECAETFRSLKDAADEFAQENGITRDQAIGRAMATLGRPRELEARYGSNQEFAAEFKRYCSPRSTPSPAKSQRRRRP